MDEPSIRHRNTLKRHYTMTSNVLIFGYKQLTDAVKLTYQAIDSFDWSDGGGKRKGYAFPSLSTLAELRGVDERTMRRHLSALESVNLLRRELRSGRPSLLWIEEPSKEECEAYLSTMTTGPDTDVRGRGDTDVRPIDEEAEKSETDKTVNAAKASKGNQLEAKVEWLAHEMQSQLEDRQSQAWFRQIALTVPEQRIFEALSEVRQASRDLKLRRKGALFTSLILKGTKPTQLGRKSGKKAPSTKRGGSDGSRFAQNRD